MYLKKSIYINLTNFIVYSKFWKKKNVNFKSSYFVCSHEDSDGQFNIHALLSPQ